MLFLSSWKSREVLIRTGVLIRENMVITVVPVLGFLRYQQSSYQVYLKLVTDTVEIFQTFLKHLLEAFLGFPEMTHKLCVRGPF